jgi:hypothetical protein
MWNNKKLVTYESQRGTQREYSLLGFAKIKIHAARKTDERNTLRFLKLKITQRLEMAARQRWTRSRVDGGETNMAVGEALSREPLLKNWNGFSLILSENGFIFCQNFYDIATAPNKKKYDNSNGLKVAYLKYWAHFLTCCLYYVRETFIQALLEKNFNRCLYYVLGTVYWL